MKNGRVHDINAASSRSPSRLSVSGRSSRSSMSAYNVEEKNRIKELMESGSGNKVRQTLQMILMVIIPIIALLSFTTVALISALETSAQASQAKKQMKLIFQVSWIGSCQNVLKNSIICDVLTSPPPTSFIQNNVILTNWTKLVVDKLVAI